MDRQESKTIVPVYERMAVLKAYKCSSCNRIYSAQVYSNNVAGRIPLLMTCSHTICEECLKFMLKLKTISCKLCKYERSVRSDEELSKNFPVDRFMFGSLLKIDLDVHTKHNASENKLKNLPYSPAGSKMQNLPQRILQRNSPISHDDSSSGDRKTCSQAGCSKRAEFRCTSCSELYCTKCDKRVHESIRILRNHVRYPIDIADLSEFNVSCATHPDSVGEYLCITCGNMLCSKCVIKGHTTHEVISIEDKNAQELESFKEVMKKGKAVLKTMEFTQKNHEEPELKFIKLF